ncbi:NAD(P)-dependent dehydrogenase, short-chain alcohol dehydrogenase family [Solimonas aquatica]|uniref:NAD(P)-dependent dehydrogenase, short-chain alcohol dehydrogenase family n=1 Tax=Solimonas aquatica TaxID=489703 RepID=A0A1H9I0U7_9GAMM|nr:SDR family NAD(P)-dependent oxidoreductase [Solimonas aquatica]SEQ68226.1 NAD(P)-dependent dehydrogenase, short-chain alcohol dehydrogenase family [Solimonas aquatica]
MNTDIPQPYTPAPDLLRGRRILITGAGDGLGRATAIACAQHGATVVLLGRTVKKLEAVYDEIEKIGGPAPAIYPLHLGGASWTDYFELASTLERELGGLDGLLHCAAHFKNFSPLYDIEPKDWIEGLQVNLTAAFSLTRHCLPLLTQSADASIVFVSDRQGHEPRAFGGIYAISKAGVEHMAAIWAQELATHPRLRVNRYTPPPMRTAIRLKGYSGELPEQVPPPEQAVSPLLWLLGPDSQGHSGGAY